MEWIKLKDQKPKEKQEVEFPADKERDGIIQGVFSDNCFWSSFDGYHEPEIWRPYHPEHSNPEDDIMYMTCSSCGEYKHIDHIYRCGSDYRSNIH